MTEKPLILVVDDEADVRATLADYLKRAGLEVRAACDAAEARAQLELRTPDLVLLDLNMPGEGGISLARHIRERFGIGVIMVTAAGSTVDRVVGLEVGADDYVAKPFDLRELLARVRAVLRRAPKTLSAPGGAAPVTPGTPPVRIGRCWLDLDGRRLLGDDGADVPITAMEFDLLQAFATRPNRVLSRDQLLDLAHNREFEPFDRSIDIRVARLRKKVEADPAKPQALKTIRGAGYMFVPARHG